MSCFWKFASSMVLPLSLALVATGCMAQAGDEDPADEQGVAADQAHAPEQTGVATEKQCGLGGCGLGGFGGCGLGGFGGCGLGGFGGCGLGGFGGCGLGGFGGCGFGGFGGCSGFGFGSPFIGPWFDGSLGFGFGLGPCSAVPLFAPTLLGGCL